MKKIFNFILVAAALFMTASAAKAQTYEYVDNDSGICYNKSITKPNTQGVYNIVLESFVKGKVTVTHEVAPSDIVLVLDYSSSMTRTVDNLTPLKNAVSNFVAKIKETNENVTKETIGTQQVGHRIALVIFSGSVHEGNNQNSNLNKFLDVDQITTDNGSVTYGGTNLINRNTQTGTNTPAAMEKAEAILSAAYTAGNYPSGSKRTRVVVMFTDGEPYINGTAQPVAMNNTITVANRIKTSTTFGATVFTVGLFNGHTGADMVTTYMRYTSSDETNKTITYTTSGSTWNPTYTCVDPEPVSGKYSIIVANASALDQVFESISGQSVDPTPLDGETVTTVDVVSASFKLPPGANVNSITVATAHCKGTKTGYYKDKDGNIVSGTILDFDPAVDKDSPDTDVDDNITVELSASDPAKPEKLDRIEVKGFNYGENFCGPTMDGDAITGYNGYKVIVKIPIMMDDNAVGGPNVNTNAPGSGIKIAGQEKPIIEFESPKVSLPINLHINKRGLDEGESAKFTIERAVLPSTWTTPATSTDKAYDNLDWKEVTSVFVTRRNGQLVNAPITKIQGLPSTNNTGGVFVYRIREDNWSWSYESSAATATVSELLVTNPFIFTNTKKENIDVKVRHAESKATNIFRKQGKAFNNGKAEGTSYDDSKPPRQQLSE